ncbi:MAG: hypothetical protein IJK54_05790 [Clostridia bacterium]|nr:hypothetical protein [Clostridia bacterium]
MKNRLKRIICLVLAVLMLLAFGACSGKKDENKNENKENGNTIEEPATPKNQVVHVGETVQYGDLTFTFEKQGIDFISTGSDYYYVSSCDTCIHISCANNGQNNVEVSPWNFSIYADGNTVENDPYYSGYYLRHQVGVDSWNKSVTVAPGRTGDLWVIANAPFETNMIEFDYVNPDYSNRWGKITFVIAVPHEALPPDNAVVGTWTCNMGGWIDSYTFNADGTGINGSNLFTYQRITENNLLLTWEDGKFGGYRVLHYSFSPWNENTLILDERDYEKK